MEEVISIESGVEVNTTAEETVGTVANGKFNELEEERTRCSLDTIWK